MGLKYNEYDLKFYAEALSEIERFLGLDEISDEEVWAVARRSKEIPSFEKVFMELTFEQIENIVTEKYPGIEFSAYYNAANSGLSVNHQDIYGKTSFKDAIESYVEENALLQENSEMIEEELGEDIALCSNRRL